MNSIVRTILSALGCFALLAGPAHALTASTADDICASDADPCIISASYDVTGELDFGDRTVRLIGAARLRGKPDISITAGQLELQTGATAYPVIEGDGSEAGSVRIEVLTGALLGDGRIGASGISPGNAIIRAHGDVILQRRLNFSGTAPGGYGAEVEIWSRMGSVVATGMITVATALGEDYDYGASDPGYVEIRAAVDVDISGGIDALGTAYGGTIELAAGRDVIIGSTLRGAAGDGSYANGGTVQLAAGRNVLVVQVPGGDAVQEINTDGGGRVERYGYGYGLNWESGYGGYQYVQAEGDITLAASARLHANGGPGAAAGYIYLYADGDIDIAGEIHAIGPPPEQSGDGGAAGGSINISGEEGITLAQGAVLRTASLIGGGYVDLHSNGPIRLHGEVDVRGTQPINDSYDDPRSGDFRMYGGDIEVGGKVLAGAGGRNTSGEQVIEACRLHLTSSARIDASFGSPNPRNDGIDITIRESMVADAGSKILVDPVSNAETFISHRDEYKPPVLNGTITPAAVVDTDPSLEGCPVCGNAEIDEGESCDDGNTTSGDGCREDCQDEGCLAESPGFPSSPLCDDGAGCTDDRCDPVAHRCLHSVTCEEGVACTADACVADTCQHQAIDSACDDHNACTDDLCNAATGCVYADLTGPDCNDDDFCTPAGTCSHGDCVTLTGMYALAASLDAALLPGDGNDKFKARIDLPHDDAGDPAVTGLTFAIVDDQGRSGFLATLDAQSWVGVAGGRRFRFRDRSGAASGVSSAILLLSESAGVARLRLKMKGTEMPDLSGQDRVNISVLFGDDTATDACLTALRVPCTSRGSGLECRTVEVAEAAD